MELHGTETPTKKASGDADDGVHDAKPKGVEAGPTPATSSPPRAERVPRSAGENAERNLDCSNGRNVRPGRSISEDNNMIIFLKCLFYSLTRYYLKTNYLFKFI